MKDLRVFSLKAWLVKAAAGQPGKGLQFVVGLQIVDPRNRNA